MKGDKKCGICKLVTLLAGLGALNWGLVGIFHKDLVARFLGDMTTGARVVYVVIGVAGLIKLITLVKCCPCKGGSCESK